MHLSTSPPDAETTAALMSAPWVALDTEFDSDTHVLPNPHRKPGSKNRPMPDQLNAYLVGFSLWWPGCPYLEGVYLPVTNSDPFEEGTTWRWLYDFLKNYTGQVWMHNAVADLTVMTNKENCLPFPKNACDSMVLAWCLGKRPPGAKKGLSLDALIRRDLGVEGGKSFQETFGGRSASEVEPAVMAPYAARDAWYTGRLVEKYLKELDAQPKLKAHVFATEMPLLRTVVQMYQEGVAINEQAMQDAARTLKAQERAASAEFTELTSTWVDMPVKVKRETGEFFKNGNPKFRTVQELETQYLGAKVTSDQQVARWLVDELGWWPREMLPTTKEGRPGVDAMTVTKLTSLPDPCASRAAVLRLQANKLSKLRGTYVEPFPLYAEKHGDGRVHADMHQTGTETGRFSSSNPNMQNLPRPSEDYYGLELPNVRAAIVAPPGRLLLGADYGQLELRLVAHLSGDENLCRAFNEGLDPHQATIDKVKELFGMDIDRPTAKITNFSTIYRISAKALGEKLGVPKHDAAKIIKGFFAQYPGIREYHNRAVAYARKHNKTHTLGGFVRHLDYPAGGCEKDGSRAPKTKYCGCGWCRKASHEDNKAINTPVQGSAGVLMKRAMVALEEKWRGTDNRILMQVHDELLCEVRPRALGQVNHAVHEFVDIKCAMEGAMQLRVPLVAEPKVGRTWAELK